MILLQTLEVSKTANAAAITKAYRKLAKKKHPDKGGDPEEFKRLAEAYEVRYVRRRKRKGHDMQDAKRGTLSAACDLFRGVAPDNT